MNKDLDDGLQWVQKFKKDFATFKREALRNPLPFLTPEFKQLLKEEKIKNSIVDKKSTTRKAFMIPPEIYHLDQSFWQSELKNKKAFKRKYPYFYVGQ